MASGVKRAFSKQEGEVDEGAHIIHVAPISHHGKARSGLKGAGQSGEWLAERGETDIQEVSCEPEWRRTVRRTLNGKGSAMQVPNSQEDVNGKCLTMGNWLIVKPQSGHEGDEQSVAGQAIYRTSSYQKSAGRLVPKGCQMVKRGAEQPGER